ncbi:uncharacterized protein N7518_009284 [Penicillium psychrosexuale]|uniref:uncharacterized protein n=1 Tax=Penicillium psychrosexuale TaxID=1002107 RepID=UPI0025452C72|nr:uncharacterized protein N7518_009284 [Penicillium psychrosexuale]KAJ5783607.1 hypothetical protein N7518_009284 [Penicillium psychrosexuale]
MSATLSRYFNETVWQELPRESSPKKSTGALYQHSVGEAEAAALPPPFIAAYYALTSLAALQSGESVLIHDAASDVGQAAIVLSQQLGATIFMLSKSSAEA